MNLRFLAATLAWIACCATAPDWRLVHAGDRSQLPHIVLVMADDQGWGDMAYNGHPILHTPNFDEAAGAGLRFDRFYAAAPVCSPTRASVLTGRHPNRMGVFAWGHPLRPQETTIAESLKRAGYVCGHFGKWHLGSVRRTSPVNPGANGFDHWVSAPNFYDNNAVMSDRGRAVRIAGESSTIAVDAAIEWIGQQVQSKQPLLAVVWFGSPHVPHRAAEADKSHYLSLSDKQQNFYGEITGMDRAFGKLRAALSALQIRQNTLLWYCSDNGGLPRLGATGGRGNKGSIYDGGLLVPSFLEWPAQIPKPRQTSQRCNTCDIYPTLLEIVGQPLPLQYPLDGISLVELLSGQPKQRRAMGFWAYPTAGQRVSSEQLMNDLLQAQQEGGDLEPDERSRLAAKLPGVALPTDQFPGHSAWLSGDWKLHRIAKRPNDTMWELYNLQNDPMEQCNLLESERERVSAMRKQLSAWQTSVLRSLNGDDYASD